jgi:hypothetical protein
MLESRNAAALITGLHWNTHFTKLIAHDCKVHAVVLESIALHGCSRHVPWILPSTLDSIMLDLLDPSEMVQHSALVLWQHWRCLRMLHFE